MLYCPNCQALCSEEKRCPFCGSKKLREPQESDPVYLITLDETKAEMVKTAFKTEHLPYEERISGLGGPPSVITGQSAFTNKRIFVPYGQLETARGIIDQMEPMKSSGPAEQESDDEQDSAMSPLKRTIVRAVSILLFILAVWGIVTASDYVANLLKGLLSNIR